MEDENTTAPARRHVALVPSAPEFVPEYGSPLAAGADLRAAIDEPIRIEPGETASIPTGIRMSLPPDCFGAVYARSGLSTREGLRPANCTGVIDADYTGEIQVVLINDSARARIVTPGQRIAQLVVQPYVRADFHVVERLDDTERGEGGFGSTGRE